MALYRAAALTVLSAGVSMASWSQWLGDAKNSAYSGPLAGPSNLNTTFSWITAAQANNFSDPTAISVAYDAGIVVYMNDWPVNYPVSMDSTAVVYAISTGSGTVGSQNAAGSMVWNVSYPQWNNLLNDGLLVCDTDATGSKTMIIAALRTIRGESVFTALSPDTGAIVWSITNNFTYAWIAAAGTGNAFQCSNGMLVASYDAGAGLQTASLRAWDVSSGAVITVTSDVAAAGSIMIIDAAQSSSSDGVVVIACTECKTDAVSAVDIATGRMLWSEPAFMQPFGLITSPDGAVVSVMDMTLDNNTIWVLNAASGALEATLHFPNNSLIMNSDAALAWSNVSSSSGPDAHGTLYFSGSLTNYAEPQLIWGHLLAWEITGSSSAAMTSSPTSAVHAVSNSKEPSLSLVPSLVGALDMRSISKDHLDPDGMYEYALSYGLGVDATGDHLYITWLPYGFNWSPPADDDAPANDQTFATFALATLDRSAGTITITSNSSLVMNEADFQIALGPLDGQMVLMNGTHVFMVADGQ